MSDGLFTGQVPQVARVLLRIDYADGRVREFEAQKPYDLECTVDYPALGMPLTGDPLALPVMEVTRVRLGFSANHHPRYLMVMRAEADESAAS